MVELLSIGAGHGNRGGLIQTLIKEQGQQRRQHAGVVLVIGVAETGEHRGHVLGGLDVLAFHVVNARCHLDVRGETIQQLRPQHRRQRIGMTEVGSETVEGVAQGSMAVEA